MIDRVRGGLYGDAYLCCGSTLVSICNVFVGGLFNNSLFDDGVEKVSGDLIMGIEMVE
jgi:hypothetical protein